MIFLYLALSCAACAATWLLTRRHEQRLAVLTAQGQIVRRAATFPAGGTVVFGDSLTSQTWFGGDVLNAGVSGGHLEDDFAFIDRVVDACRPERIVIAYGVNNAPRDSVDGFIARYASLIAHLGRPVVIVGIWPTDGRHAAFIAEANASLRLLARATGSDFVAPPATAETTDGVHLAPPCRIARAARILQATRSLGSSPATSTARP